MIYTVTFNPSLDYVVGVDKFIEGEVNRTVSEYLLPGGKGINVSTILTNLGLPNIALGYVAGFVGSEIIRQVTALGCNTDFIGLDEGNSRINVKIKAGKESEINGSGPVINSEAIEKLYSKLDLLREGDILVLAGSIPKSLPDTIYKDIMERLNNRSVRIIVDATGKLLVNVLQYKPFLIKPNKSELSEIFETSIESDEQVVQYAKELIKKGAQNVLVSMAAEGAILVCSDETVYHCNAPDGKVVNSVGAGDSMVAGFIAGYVENGDYEHALKMGIASGSASAFSKDLATKQEIMKVYGDIRN